MNIIIIEDEPRTANDLQSILESIDSDINVLEILPSVVESIEWFKEHPSPDLIFSDIQLGDGLSFEIFKEIDPQSPIIFCTAFDQYAIQAFEANSIDYLLKPIEEQKVARSLTKFRKLKQHYSNDSFKNNLDRVVEQMDINYKQSILVTYRDKMIPVKVKDLCFIYASNGIVTLHTNSNQDYAIQYTIDQLQTMLNPAQFFRANRQFIINRDIIQNIEHYFNRRLIIKVNCPTPIKLIVSRLKSQDFLRWIES